MTRENKSNLEVIPLGEAFHKSFIKNSKTRDASAWTYHSLSHRFLVAPGEREFMWLPLPKINLIVFQVICPPHFDPFQMTDFFVTSLFLTFGIEFQ